METSMPSTERTKEDISSTVDDVDDHSNGPNDDHSMSLLESDEDDYEYEDEDDDHGNLAFLLDNPSAVVERHDATPELARQIDAKLSGHTSSTAGHRRLAKDLFRIMRSGTNGFAIAPKADDCLDVWTIDLAGFDADSDLAKDLKVLGRSAVQLEMSFPDNYPFEPPFVRVKSPRFARSTGHVIDGALCMELLTQSGWNPINDIESVIVSIRSLLVEGGGRLQDAQQLSQQRYQQLLHAHPRSNDDDDLKNGQVQADATEYSEAEARKGHKYVCEVHEKQGWSNRGIERG